MNPTLLLLTLPMVLIAIGVRVFLHQTITWLEAAGQLLIGVIVVGVVWGISTYSLTADTETLNGYVTGKARNEVSCSHSYRCNCYTTCSGSGKTRSCSEHCSTCYDHSYDVDWDVGSTVGGFTIARVDRQGLSEPARWSHVQTGDPVAVPHGYTNYVKGAPDSLFHVIGDFKGTLPEYPGFYDYQFSDRVIGAPRDAALWNRNLALSLRTLGAEKQVNFVIVISDQPKRFAEALRSKWLGGKKNDIIVVVGAKHYPTIDWVEVFSWSKLDIVNVSLRQDLLESRSLDPVRTIDIIARNARAHYVRRPMSDFEYLKDDVKPSAWVLVLALILGTAASAGAAYIFHRNGVNP
ncbi:hypothetical protein [Novosphingobium resinovorum]|uniref:hypothetical protein n=1 Tax=Novosphingobium resinovorum TaxID=158500 RepID=UPI0012EAF7C2|nr:hypothetical protein [Novosphingobium resinovorum]